MMRQGQRWVTQPHGGMVGVRGCFSNGWSLLVSEREPSDTNRRTSIVIQGMTTAYDLQPVRLNDVFDFR